MTLPSTVFGAIVSRWRERIVHPSDGRKIRNNPSARSLPRLPFYHHTYHLSTSFTSSLFKTCTPPAPSTAWLS